MCQGATLEYLGKAISLGLPGSFSSVLSDILGEPSKDWGSG